MANRGYTVEEMGVQTEAVRRAIQSGRVRLEERVEDVEFKARREIRELKGSVGGRTISMLTGVVGALLLILSLNFQVNDLNTRVVRLEQDRVSLTNQLEGEKLRRLGEINELNQKLTQRPPVFYYSVKVTDFVGTLAGKGTFNLKIQALKDPKGIYTKEEAWDELARQMGEVVKECNIAHRDYSSRGSSESLTWEMESSSSGTAFTGSCQATLEALTGKKLSDRLPETAVSDLKGMSGTGVGTLFVQADGRLLGQWRGDYPTSEGKTCVEKSLEAIGWIKGTPYFTVNPNNRFVSSVLYQNAFGKWYTWVVDVPDLCQAANMVPSVKPDWLEYAHLGGTHVLKTEGLEVRLVSATGGRTAVTVNDRQVGTVDRENLILVETDFASLEKMVYLTVDGETLRWYRPKGPGYWGSPVSLSYQVVPSVEIAPNIDNIKPWVSVKKEASAYLVDGKIVKQSKVQ